MNQYTFAITPAVTSGPGCISTLPEWVGWLGGHRPLIVSDRALSQAGIPQRVQALLPGSRLFDAIDGEPTIELVMRALEAVRESDTDLVIAVGGGSAIDCGKLAAMLATNGGELVDYATDWDLVTRPGLPLITIPTTVGSGSEMTRGAVFKDPSRHSKLVVVSDHLAARLAVLDPTLLETLPSQVTIATGCDALTQAMEGVLSTAANPFTDALHLHAIRIIRRVLPDAVRNSRDTDAIGGMQQAAAMVGAALARSGVGAAHAVANTLGGHYPIPHGLACAAMLGPTLRLNAAAASERYGPIATALGISGAQANGHAAKAVTAATERLLADVGVTWHLRDFEVPESDLPALAEEARTHSDMSTNPLQPSTAQVLEMLRQVW